jgi:hypothetical protein
MLAAAAALLFERPDAREIERTWGKECMARNGKQKGKE